MARQFILYNLKDDVSDEDFEKWTHEFKGPLIMGLNSVKHYTLTKVGAAMEVDGWPPTPIDIPYKYIGVVEMTSLEEYAKDQQTPKYQKEFMPEFVKRVKAFLILKADEVFDQ